MLRKGLFVENREPLAYVVGELCLVRKVSSCVLSLKIKNSFKRAIVFKTPTDTDEVVIPKTSVCFLPYFKGTSNIVFAILSTFFFRLSYTDIAWFV